MPPHNSGMQTLPSPYPNISLPDSNPFMPPSAAGLPGGMGAGAGPAFTIPPRV